MDNIQLYPVSHYFEESSKYEFCEKVLPRIIQNEDKVKEYSIEYKPENLYAGDIIYIKDVDLSGDGTRWFRGNYYIF